MTMSGHDYQQRWLDAGVKNQDFARMARVSKKSLNNFVNGVAGPEVQRKVLDALRKLESGEVIPLDPHTLDLEPRPGIHVIVRAGSEATLGDLREVEDRLRRLLDGN
jgi:hypothetical protein